MENTFEVIDHTADIGIVAYGSDIEQLYVNASLGMCSLITDLDNLNEDLCHIIDLASTDRENLLVEWLNELLYIFEVDHIIFKKFEIDNLTNNQIRARCFGEKINIQQHKIIREIKAATYHMLAIVKENDIFRARVIFDI